MSLRPTNRTTILSVLLTLTVIVVACTAFTTPSPTTQRHRVVVLNAVQDDVSHSNSNNDANALAVGTLSKVVMTTAVAVMTSPLAALAEEAEYEYGSVNAPIWIAWAAGALAILTALLPIALQGGEEAFEKMREKDEGTWGTGKSSALDRNRRR